MRVLLTGSLTPWDLGASYRRAFESLGHEVELFGWYERQHAWSRRAAGRVSRALLVAAARRRTAVDLVLRATELRPDLIVLLKTDDLPLGAIGLLRSCAPGCRVVAFHPDDPFNVHRLRGPSHPRSLYQMRAVDRYFIWSERLVGRVERAGARAASYLGFACDPEITHRIEVTASDRARFGADVSFIGNWDAKREAWLAPLASAGDVSLAIWGGPDWGNRARDRRVLAAWKGEAPRGDDLVRAVLCSRTSINVLRVQNETAENMRTYEIPACGGVMLAEWSAQQERVFRSGIEAEFARDPQELAGRARAMARSPPEVLARMSAAGLRRSSEHTYRARARRILELCEMEEGAPTASRSGRRPLESTSA